MKGKLIFAILFVLVFTSCGGGGSETDTPTEASPTATTPAPTVAETTTTPEPTPEPIVYPDLGGRVVRFGSQAMYWAQSVGAHNEEVGWVIPGPDDAMDAHMRYENRLRVEELFNIVIEPVYIPGGEIMDRLTTSHLAGENYVDLFYISPPTVLNAYKRGLILPIDDLLRPDSDVLNEQLYMWSGVTVDGNLLGVTRPIPVFNQQGIFVNMDIIEALGLPNPVDLFNNGEWTWEAMRNIISQATTGEYFGFGGPLGAFTVNLIASNGTTIMNPNTLELNFDTPQVMAAIEFVTGIIDNNWFFVPDPSAEDYLIAGANTTSFIHQKTALNFVNGTAGINAERNAAGGTLPMQFNWLPMPIGPNNTVGTTFSNNGRDNEGVVFGAEDPEVLFWILEELFKWSGEEYWIEHEADHDWARNWAPDEATVQRLANNGRNMVIDLGPMTVMGGGYFNSMILAHYNGEMTVAQFIEQNRAEREQMRRDWFGLD